MISDFGIKSMSKDLNLIEPFNDENLQPASYDVTLSKQILLFEQHGVSSYIDGQSRELNRVSYQNREIGDNGYLLNPNEFILGSTNEKVNVPSSIACRFEGKSSLGRIGLSTHVTAGFIDPGFHGNITLEITNHNSVPILLHFKQLIGQLCFFEMDHSANRPYGSEELNSHYQNQESVTGAR